MIQSYEQLYKAMYEKMRTEKPTEAVVPHETIVKTMESTEPTSDEERLLEEFELLVDSAKRGEPLSEVALKANE